MLLGVPIEKFGGNVKEDMNMKRRSQTVRMEKGVQYVQARRLYTESFGNNESAIGGRVEL